MSDRSTEALPPGAIACRVTRHGAHGVEPATWGIADEVAVELQLDGAPWTLCMATPSDLEELAIGLALTEGVVAEPDDIASVTTTQFLQDFRVSLTLRRNAKPPVRRSVSPTGACGLCGLESLAALAERPATRRGPTHVIPIDAVRRAFIALPDHQHLNAATRSVHAAAWCTSDGDVQLVREDVGRHNALDKLVGALARTNRLGETGFIIMTSRCSYELVAKSARTNAQLLATWSAPTAMALRWAGTIGMPLLSVQQQAHALTLVAHSLETPDAVD